MIYSGPGPRAGRAGGPGAADAALESAKGSSGGACWASPRQGAGASFTRFWKAGSVDCKKLVELRGVDLEQYRGKGREEVRERLRRDRARRRWPWPRHRAAVRST